MTNRALAIVAAAAALLLPTTSASAGATALARSARPASCQTLGHAADITPHPSKEACDRAKKILTSWERLAQKMGVKISKRRRQELRRKTTDGTIRISDLPATLRRQFPSELAGYDLNQIINICNGLPPGNGRTIVI